MNLHEFQAKGLLRSYGVPVPDGGVASTASDALRVAKSLKAKSGLSKPRFTQAEEEKPAVSKLLERSAKRMTLQHRCSE